MKINRLHIIALASHGKGISGGDRIYIELARRWGNKFPITIHTWREGVAMMKRQELQTLNSKSKNQKRKSRIYLNKIRIRFCNWSFVVCYLSRILAGIRLGLTLKIENEPTTYIYNASEFWMDSFACALLKLRHKRVRWIATWYQTAPPPWKGFAEGVREKTYGLSSLLYWLAQVPIKPLVKVLADKVIVNNKSEKKQFPKMNTRNDVVVMLGAVRIDLIRKYNKKSNKNIEAVFQGRFHPQKGVVELVRIWKKVVSRIPSAKLVMIGDGPLMPEVRKEIRTLKLRDKIRLAGYVFDGAEKFDIFSRSKIVVHPAFFDSGGMAAMEAMAFGLPVVGFDLPAYKSYYPKGIKKVGKGNLNAFAESCVDLLGSRKDREKLGKEAKSLAEEFSWERRAEEILNNIQ